MKQFKVTICNEHDLVYIVEAESIDQAESIAHGLTESEAIEINKNYSETRTEEVSE